MLLVRDEDELEEVRELVDPEILLLSAEEAETGFLSSPGHRGNVLDPRARRVGVGVAFGPPVTGTRPLYVTQLFTN